MATEAIGARIEALGSMLRGMGSVVVAFSGGVDSALVAVVAARELGERALAVTGVSAALPHGELDETRRVAAELRVAHRTVPTDELADARYTSNGADRCYHCKSELYDVLSRIAREEGFAVVASGANLDDLGDVRPGLRAAQERGVRHPLVETGFGKDHVRDAARELEIPVWDKPASACLSSRIAFGQTITVGELTRVGRAERFLKDLGFRQCRVRVHGELARIEVEGGAMERLLVPEVREAVVERLRELGYAFVTFDLEGFRSGSMLATAEDAGAAGRDVHPPAPAT